MGLFDWFVSALSCSACGEVSAADAGTNAQTKLRARPRQERLCVGAPLQVSIESGLNAGYIAAGPYPGDALRILQGWECPACGSDVNWLRVVVEDGRITAIEAVPMSQAVLADAHLVEEEALLREASRRSGRSTIGMSSSEALSLLRGAGP